MQIAVCKNGINRTVLLFVRQHVICCFLPNCYTCFALSRFFPTFALNN